MGETALALMAEDIATNTNHYYIGKKGIKSLMGPPKHTWEGMGYHFKVCVEETRGKNMGHLCWEE